MRFSTHLLLRMLAILLVGTWPSAAEEEGPIVLETTPHRVHASLYDPIVLVHQVENQGSDAIGDDSFCYLPGNLILDISYPDGRTVPWSPESPDVGCIATVELQPGKTITAETDLFWTYPNGLLFPEPGSYLVRTKLMVQDEWIESATVTIEVALPTTADRGLLADLGGDAGLIKLLDRGPREYCTATGLQDCHSTLIQIIRKHRSSSYAADVCRAVLWSLSVSSPAVEPRYSLGVEIAQECIALWPDDSLAPQFYLQWAELLAYDNRVEEAQKVLHKFREQWPNREEALTRMSNFLPAAAEMGRANAR